MAFKKYIRRYVTLTSLNAFFLKLPKVNCAPYNYKPEPIHRKENRKNQKNKPWKIFIGLANSVDVVYIEFS